MDQSFHDSILEGIGEEIAFASSDRVPAVTCTIEGDPLTEADLAHYIECSGNLPAQKSYEKDIAVLRARHHQVARLLATGMPEGVVAELTGYEASYISTLKLAPNMIELISHYRAPGDNATKIIGEKLRLMADMSVEQIIQKIEAGEFDNNQLLAAAKLGADRSNNGPMAKVEHEHHFGLDDATVKKLAETARRVNQSRIIDISAVRKSLPSPEGDEPDAA